ncbi:MAG: DUF1570 domain-containing protein [Kiritimatiellia bacterium]|nr:DUF1570 domain-containing protein [Kiritimatiellia bacterium]
MRLNPTDVFGYPRRRWLIAGVATWILMAGCAAAAPKGFSFGTTVVLKDEGLKFKAFNGAKAQILPPPTVHHYTGSDGQQSERYAPRELWYASQYRGRWINPAGQALTLAVIGQSLPKGFSEQHIIRQAYDEALALAPDPISNSAALPAWLSDFSGAAVKGEPRTLPDSIQLKHVLAIEFEGRNPARRGYVFSLKSSIGRVDPERRFFALFEWQDALPPADAIRVIERDFLPSVESLGGPAPTPAAASPRMQNKAVAGKVERSAEFLQSREKAINSIKGMKGWWFVETANYVLVSDLPVSQRQFVRQLQSDLEYLHAAYTQILPPRVAIEAVSVVRIFNKADAYDQYVGPEHSWTSGSWLPDKKELVIKPAAWGDMSKQQEAVAETVYHEAFHQYIFYAFDKIHASAWYNEGQAAFFEGAQIAKKGFEAGEVEHYRQVVDALITKKRVELQNLFVMSYDGFYTKGGEEGRREHYALAWGLIYYLRKGAPLEKNHAYDRLLDDYADSLFQTRNPEEATRKMLATVDMAQFTAAFNDFWKSETRRLAARRNAIFKNVAVDLPQE